MNVFEVDITRLKSARREKMPIRLEGALNTRDFNANVCAEGFAGHTDGELFAFSGRITAVVSVACARCLAPVEFPYDSPLDFNFSFCEGGENGEYGETLCVLGNCLDMSGVIAGTIRADIPISVLCAEACKGLCAVCGNNLNVNDCGCKKELINPVLKITDYMK